MPRKAQPVPPIFQPEVAAEAIVYCAHHNRTEMWVGWPTVKAILANRFNRHFADVEAAKLGWDSQMYDGSNPPGQPDDLYAPVAGDHGAHGAFDARSRNRNPAVWLSLHRPALLSAWLDRRARSGAGR